jgi:hypothetical protein
MLEVIVYDHDNNSKDDTVGGLRLDKKEMLRIMSQSIGMMPLCTLLRNIHGSWFQDLLQILYLAAHD